MGFARLAIHGNLTRAPEMRQTQDGVSVCNFTVAVNVFKGGAETVEYVRVTAWRTLADRCIKYLKKGSGVVVWGRAGMHTWNDKKDGSAKGCLELEAEGFDFAGARPRDDSEAEAAPAAAQGNTEMTEADDDELPF